MPGPTPKEPAARLGGFGPRPGRKGMGVGRASSMSTLGAPRVSRKTNAGLGFTVNVFTGGGSRRATRPSLPWTWLMNLDLRVSVKRRSPDVSGMLLKNGSSMRL